MDLTFELEAPVSPARLFVEVEDLEGYPGWLGLVLSASPGPPWDVEIGARVGPVRRAKRLRMERTVHDPPNHVRFERREADGEAHSRWVLDAVVRPVGPGSHLRVQLSYGGGLGPLGPVLERVLAVEVARARPRLLARLT